ncbi:uncharacterized protein LOC119721107 [Patiria miniata]|uniref:Uncharacterized protein n=1 Tax=Patiria miniata TaxID=46514 RepID=A0A913Z7E3_PATMI|nr:uncharacterized protein LOC119721107 [Patiria miniata]
MYGTDTMPLTLGVGDHPRTETSATTTTTTCTMDNNNDGQVVTANHTATKTATSADRPTTLQMQDKPKAAKDLLISKIEDLTQRPDRRREAWGMPRCTREKSKEAEDVVLTCDRARGDYYLEDAPYQGFNRSPCCSDDYEDEEDDDERLEAASYMKNNSSSNYSQSHLDFSGSSCHSSPGFLRHHHSYDHLKSSTAYSAPSSPATTHPHQRHAGKKLLHRAEHSSPDLVSSAAGGNNKGRLRKSLFKRFSGNNKDDLTGGPRAGSMREKKNGKKVVESKKVSQIWWQGCDLSGYFQFQDLS